MRTFGKLLLTVGLIGLGLGWLFGPFVVGARGTVISVALAVVGLLMMILSAMTRRNIDAPSHKTHVRCPDCRELVRFDASKCKHCGAALIPRTEADMRK
ncbi:MAG: hypothetical protein O9341_09115 [Paucibacter sp.]|nr:hypothetical protein [Roseateles sp.]